MEQLEQVLNRIAVLENQLERVSTLPGNYVPVPTALTESGGALNGGALNIGAYTVGPIGSGATYAFGYPSYAKALTLFVTAKWGAAADGTFLYINAAITGSSVLVMRSLVAAITNVAAAMVALDANAKFSIGVAGANATAAAIYVTGYFL